MECVKCHIAISQQQQQHEKITTIIIITSSTTTLINIIIHANSFECIKMQQPMWSGICEAFFLQLYVSLHCLLRLADEYRYIVIDSIKCFHWILLILHDHHQCFNWTTICFPRLCLALDHSGTLSAFLRWWYIFVDCSIRLDLPEIFLFFLSGVSVRVNKSDVSLIASTDKK